MNILVYGAGVIGSVYAARLQEAGYHVSLLARGQRAEALRTQGILLEDESTGQRTTTRVAVVEQLAPTDSYDVIIVTVRLDHLASILPILAANRQIPTVLFMLNNPIGMPYLEMLEAWRVVLGFPSVGGVRQGDVVRYRIAPRFFTMTLGKEEGHVTPRIQQLATIFKQAGFSVSLHADMEGWLKTHAVFDVCILTAATMAGGKSAQLGRSRKQVATMVQAICEGLLALQAQAIPIAPSSMKVLFLWLPRWFVVSLWQYILRTPLVALGIDPHLHTDAMDEARQMAKDLMAQLQKSPRSTPTLHHLLTYLEIPA